MWASPRSMQKLFVNKSIKINAPASRVWDVLTNSKHTRRWANEFSDGRSHIVIDSDWKIGSPVLWKGEDGQTIVEGSVTAREPNQLLRFTAVDLRNATRPKSGRRDGITFRLSERNGRTTLDVLQGDFAGLEDDKAHRDRSAEIWDRVLPLLKDLAEN
jgi:uncharacterized protein YndB with AHSA1/START domain